MKTAADYPRLGPLNLRPGDKVRVVGPDVGAHDASMQGREYIVAMSSIVGNHYHDGLGRVYALNSRDGSTDLTPPSCRWYPASSLEVVERVGLDDATPTPDTRAPAAPRRFRVTGNDAEFRLCAAIGGMKVGDIVELVEDKSSDVPPGYRCRGPETWTKPVLWLSTAWVEEITDTQAPASDTQAPASDTQALILSVLGVPADKTLKNEAFVEVAEQLGRPDLEVTDATWAAVHPDFRGAILGLYFKRGAETISASLSLATLFGGTQ